MQLQILPDPGKSSIPSNNRGLAQELEYILDIGALTTLYQPIISLNSRTIFGYEGLIRGPRESALHSPLVLFSVARDNGRTALLDLMCREALIRNFSRHQLDGALFINVCPSALLQNGYSAQSTARYLADVGLRPENIIIELTETHPIDDYELLRDAINPYREAGFKIAIDDLGAGYSGLRGWSELRPDFVKIDRHFIQNVHEDAVKRQFIHSISEIAKGLHCQVIAEGIETCEELEVILTLEVEYAQGFLFSRPVPIPPRRLKTGTFRNERPSPLHTNRSLHVSSILQERPTLSPDTVLDDVIKLLRRFPDINYLPIVEDRQPRGIVSRLHIMDLYTNLYARDLYGRKSISQFMLRQPLTVERSSLLTQFSRQVTGVNAKALSEDFVIVDEDGHYCGMGTLLDLLRRITDLQIPHARYANPLTQLPGNVPINEQLEELLSKRLDFTLLYLDIDNFKPYNDTYGYARGDDVIRTLAQLMRTHFDANMDFLGHIGGDDFIVISQNRNWHSVTREMLRKFGQRVPRFYDERERKLGGIEGRDRQGKTLFYPFLSISVGVVPVRHPCTTDHLKLAGAACDVKRQAKRTPGNSIFVERRDTTLAARKKPPSTSSKP